MSTHCTRLRVCARILTSQDDECTATHVDEPEQQLRELHELINGLLKARIDTHTAIIRALEGAARRLRNVMYASDRAVMQTQMSVIANALRDIADDMRRGLTDTASIAARVGCPICGRTDTHMHGGDGHGTRRG